MPELTGNNYRAWQSDPLCQICNDSEMELIENGIVSGGYFPSPRVETWECKGCCTEYVDTINVKVYWEKKAHLYGRSSEQVAFLFETVNGNRVELTAVNWNNLIEDYIVAWPPPEMGKVVDLMFGQPVFEHARFLYVEGGLEEGSEIERSHLAISKLNDASHETLGFFRAIEI